MLQININNNNNDNKKFTEKDSAARKLHEKRQIHCSVDDYICFSYRYFNKNGHEVIGFLEIKTDSKLQYEINKLSDKERTVLFTVTDYILEKRYFLGTATDLWLNILSRTYINLKHWPRSSSHFSRCLSKVSPIIDALGASIGFIRRENNSRLIYMSVED